MEEQHHIHNEVIVERLKGLTELIDSRFDNVEKRLDKINGKVGKHDDFISRIKGYLVVLGVVGTGASALILERLNDFFSNK